MHITIDRGEHVLDPTRWSSHIAPHLALREMADPNDLPDAIADLFHDALLLGWTAIRKEWGRALRVNSGARSEGKQMALRASGARAATWSLHVPKFERTESGLIIYRPCMAQDLDTTSPEESRLLAECIRDCVPTARIFWSRYLPQTFVHWDVGPVMRHNRRAYLAPGETELPSAWLKDGLGDS